MAVSIGWTIERRKVAMKGSIALVLAAWSLSGPAGAVSVIHYVSPDGSEEPPYLTPGTGSRTVQAAIDVCGEGDSVIILAGDYQEHVVMKERGLKMAGAGPGVTRVWGSLRAGVDAEVSAVEFRQECAEDDPRFATFAILAPRTGSLMIMHCRIRGTFTKCVESSPASPLYMGLLLLSDVEILGDGTNAAISLWSSPEPLFVVDRCTVARCRVGLETPYGARVLITRSSFVENDTALAPLGALSVEASSIDRNVRGIWVRGWEPAHVESSTICANREGVVADEGADLELICCTIAGNETGIWLTGLCCAAVFPRKCIVWGNASSNVLVEGISASFDPWFSDIPGYEGLYGQRNISADPIFFDPQGGNYRLRPESPCIDRLPLLGDMDVAFDRDGKLRLAYGGGEDGPAVDMGAYEYHINQVSAGPGAGNVTLTWSSRSGRTYSVFYTDDLFNWHTAIENFPSLGNQTTSWTDDGSLTGLPPLLAPKRFYRVLANP